jgi:bacterioferritin-associated ferredoxin
VVLSTFGSRLTDEVVLSVAAYCPLLEHLEFAYCSAVSDSAIRRVAESCPLLQWINFRNLAITDATVQSFCNHCPPLKRVYLGFCNRLTDTAVLAVAERLPGLTHFLLRSAITSSAVETLASRCHELRYINLSHCPNISDATLAKIAEYCPRLEELHVDGCRNVTAVGEEEVRSKCPKSRILSHYIFG